MRTLRLRGDAEAFLANADPGGRFRGSPASLRPFEEEVETDWT
jgi:hypothetical protein